jgi:ketosteroid isomerase-like protein
MESGNRIESIVEYFRRVDTQNPSMIDLFTEQAEMRFPKYGVI